MTVGTKDLEPVPTWRLGNAGHALGYQVGKGAMMDGLPFSIARRVTCRVVSCRVVSILCACIRVYVRREGAWRSLRSKHMYTWKRIASKLLYYVNVTLSSILTFNYRLISEPTQKRRWKKNWKRCTCANARETIIFHNFFSCPVGGLLRCAMRCMRLVSDRPTRFRFSRFSVPRNPR